MTPGRDPGVQRERTALARQRTALALMAGGAVLARLGFDRLGPWALVGPAVTFPLTLWVLLDGRRRDRDAAAVLRDGRAPLLLTLATAGLALTELAAMLAAGLTGG